jgi:hypothetical protein
MKFAIAALLAGLLLPACAVAAPASSRHCGAVQEGGRSTYIAARSIVSDPRGGPRAPNCVNARRVAKAWLRFEAPYYDPGFHGGDEGCVKTAHRGGECTIRVPGLGLWDCGYYGRHNAKGRCARPGGSVIRWRASTSSGDVFGG